MLFVKPFILYLKHSGDNTIKHDIVKPLLSEEKAGLQEESENIELEKKEKIVIPSPVSHGHGEFDMSEIFVHQVIETIEFVLGNITI